jgi:hypothetical protein
MPRVQREIYAIDERVCLLSANYSSIDLNYENQLQVNLPGSARSLQARTHIKSLLAASKVNQKSGEKFVKASQQIHGLQKFLSRWKKKTSDTHEENILYAHAEVVAQSRMLILC